MRASPSPCVGLRVWSYCARAARFTAFESRDVARPARRNPRRGFLFRSAELSLIKTLFKESPFEPLRYHMKTVMECVAFVRPMFEAVRDERRQDLLDLTKKVFKMEHLADIIKDEIRQTIPKRFFLPVYRGDLLGYLKLQDDMADSVEDLAVLLTLKELSLPRPLVDPTFEYVTKPLRFHGLLQHQVGERLRL